MGTRSVLFVCLTFSDNTEFNGGRSCVEHLQNTGTAALDNLTKQSYGHLTFDFTPSGCIYAGAAFPTDGISGAIRTMAKDLVNNDARPECKFTVSDYDHFGIFFPPSAVGE